MALTCLMVMAMSTSVKQLYFLLVVLSSMLVL